MSLLKKNARPAVLVVGQTPPPFGGQATMVQRLLESDFSGISLCHVRMHFSKGLHETGKFKLGKCLHLPLVILRIVRERIIRKAHTLYYTPGGDNRNAILRDTLILLAVRWMFKVTVFHIHAGGFTDVIGMLPAPLRSLARRAYREPDYAIVLSALSPPDGAAIGAKHIAVISNGLPDDIACLHGAVPTPSVPEILFVGLVSESKGIFELLEATRLAHARGALFHLRVVGRFADPGTEARCLAFTREHGFEEKVTFDGVCTGRKKWERFAAASIFCLPSHFGAENQSLVIIEAMQASLPVIATRWRAIPSLVEQGQTGYLVEVGDTAALADNIMLLLEQPSTAQLLGKAGRVSYERTYALAVWQERMEKTLTEAATSVSG